MMFAARNDHLAIKMVDYLLEKGADMEARDKHVSDVISLDVKPHMHHI